MLPPPGLCELMIVDDCHTDTANQYILNYSDDTVLLTRLSNSEKPEFHQLGMKKLVEWTNNNALLINTNKTEEVVFGSPPDCYSISLVIQQEKIKQVSSFR